MIGSNDMSWLDATDEEREQAERDGFVACDGHPNRPATTTRPFELIADKPHKLCQECAADHDREAADDEISRNAGTVGLDIGPQHPGHAQAVSPSRDAMPGKGVNPGVLSCHKCGKQPEVGGFDGWEYTVVCYNCYDADCVGDPPRYVSSSIVGRGRTREEAIADWNEQTEEANEVA